MYVYSEKKVYGEPLHKGIIDATTGCVTNCVNFGTPLFSDIC